MKKTDVDFMLSFATLMSKLENGEDCTAEYEQIDQMTEENKESISQQLIDRLVSRGEMQFLPALLRVGYLDADYVQDFADALGAKDITAKQELVRRVLARTEPYGRVMMDDLFWKNLTLTAINVQDNELLTQFIRKVEQLRDSAEE